MKLQVLIGAFFVGWCSSMLWLPTLSDRYGRWFFYSSTIALDTMLFIIISLTSNIDLTILVFFIYGILTSVRMNVGFVYLMELVPIQNRIAAGTFWCLCGISLQLMISFYLHSMIKEQVSISVIAFIT